MKSDTPVPVTADGLTLAASDPERQLVQAIEEYLRCVELQLPFDRQRFLEDHADIAGLLEECLGGLEYVQLVSRRLQESTADNPVTAAGSSNPPETLGDYQLRREIGRGGMGIVYEAVQLSIGRTVALKVLPFAAVLDPRHLQRFRNEALAAANLDHPHIVDVLGVGCERGVHFYVMRHIPGTTLAQVIAKEETTRPAGSSDVHNTSGDTAPKAALSTLRSEVPATYFRRLAELGMEAADALEHAHQMGVIHRDIKPSNLLLDQRGKLWVTDFGLAHVEANNSITLPGDMLGTLRYMSPEQASGRPTLVDHRTDIYSLGATLYEMAGGRPVVEAQERAAILHAIAENDPIRLRTFTPSLPIDLETIILKCLAKEKSRRYQTAQELSDDLGRFLQQKPIHARPPHWMDSLRKSMRRHRSGWLAVSTMAFVLLLVAIVALVWKDSVTQAALAVEQIERARAEHNLQEAHAAIETLLARVATNRLLNEPKAEPLRRQLLMDALAANEKLLTLNATSVEARIGTARAEIRVGYINALMGGNAAAETAYTHAIASAERLVAELPDDHRCQDLLAKALDGIASCNFDSPRREELIVFRRRALDIRRTLFRAHPEIDEYRLELGEVAHDYAADWLLRGRLQEAIDGFHESLAIVPEAADNRVNLALALRGLGDLPAAELQLQQAVEFENPEDPHANPWARWTLAGILFEQGKLADAERQSRQAIERFEQIVAEHPDVPEYADSLGLALLSLGSSLQKTNPDEAFKCRTRAVEVLEVVVDRWADSPRYQMSLVSAYEELRHSLTRLDDETALVTHLKKEFALLDRLSIKTPTKKDIRQRLALSAHRLADHLLDGDSDAAAVLYRRAVQELTALSESQREVPRNMSVLSSAQLNLAKLLAAKNEVPEAIEWLEAAVALSESLYAGNPNDEATRDLLRSEYASLSDLLASVGKEGDANSYREKSRTLDAARTSDK